MTSQQQDKESEKLGPSAGVSISLAVAGVVAAGLGLATMRFAFAPLPTPGVPVVVSTTGMAPTQVVYHHPVRPAPARVEAVAERVLHAHVRKIRHVAAVPEPAPRHERREAAPAAEPAKAAPVVPTPAKAPAPEPKPAIQVAKAETLPKEKMCKAPGPEVLSPEALKPAMILRYDAKFRPRPLDIEPPRPAEPDETQGRIKLTALLANILDK